MSQHEDEYSEEEPYTGTPDAEGHEAVDGVQDDLEDTDDSA